MNEHFQDLDFFVDFIPCHVLVLVCTLSSKILPRSPMYIHLYHISRYMSLSPIIAVSDVLVCKSAVDFLLIRLIPPFEHTFMTIDIGSSLSPIPVCFLFSRTHVSRSCVVLPRSPLLSLSWHHTSSLSFVKSLHHLWFECILHLWRRTLTTICQPFQLDKMNHNSARASKRTRDQHETEEDPIPSTVQNISCNNFGTVSTSQGMLASPSMLENPSQSNHQCKISLNIWKSI